MLQNRIPKTAFLVACATIALTAPKRASAGEVTGNLALPDNLGKPPQRSTGFVPRVSNPLKTARSYDPRPQMVVILAGDIPAEAKAAPKRPVEISLLGESFEKRFVAVASGSRVLLRNNGRGKPRLYSPSHSDLFSDSGPVSRKGRREVQIKGEFKVFKVGDRDSVHLELGILSVPHTLFATVGSGGTFKIPNVPPGKYRVRVWFKDGWLDKAEGSVQVGRRGGKVTLKLPSDLKAKGS